MRQVFLATGRRCGRGIRKRYVVVIVLLACSIVFIKHHSPATHLAPLADVDPPSGFRPLRMKEVVMLPFRLPDDLHEAFYGWIDNAISTDPFALHRARSWLDTLQRSTRDPLPADQSPWDVVDAWFTPKQIVPEHPRYLNAVLKAMQTSPVVAVDFAQGGRGSRIKLIITLEGGQKALFKPKWFSQRHGSVPCMGADEPFAEIVAFHLSRVLGFRKTPITAWRVLSVSRDIIPAASQHLASHIQLRTSNQTVLQACFVDKCRTCNRTKCVANDTLEGSLSLWLPARFQPAKDEHPWIIQCIMRHRKWMSTPNHCSNVRNSPPYNQSRSLLLDVIEAAIFNYLLSNSDGKIYRGSGEYEEFTPSLDNGKGLADPPMLPDIPLILGPLLQCCQLRATTYARLSSLGNGTLGEVMRHMVKEDPLNRALNQSQLLALDRRLSQVIYYVNLCVAVRGRDAVLV